MENGQPLLLPYKAALGKNRTIFTLGASPITLLSTANDHASLQIPLFQDPFNPASPRNGAVDLLLPWQAQAGATGVGFSVPITAVRDMFVPANEVSLAGTTTSADVYYAPASGAAAGSIVLQAVTSTQFFGEVFLCLDPTSGDLLHAHSGSLVGPLVDWIAKHPGASTACSLFVRTTPANGHDPSISSFANGVTLLLSSGDAAGRVSGVTLFDPSVISQSH
jgi:hypothetical protein